MAVSAVVLAGGYGTRLGSLTKRTPKPMIKVGGKPVLDHILDSLRRASMDFIFVHLHYLPMEIIGAKHSVWVNYYGDKKLPGTARAILGANVPPNTEHILVLNGDTITNVDYRDMIAHHIATNADVTVYSPHNSFLHTGGIYLFRREIFDVLPPPSIQGLLRRLKSFKGRIEIYNPKDTYYYDIGTPYRLRKARRFFASQKPNPLP